LKKVSLLLSIVIIIILLPVLVSQVSSKDNSQKVRIECLNNPTQTRFRDNGDGTIHDKCTNLVWQKGTSDTHPTFNDAATYCAGLTIGNLTGWRVPTIQELTTIVNYIHTNSSYAYPSFEFGNSLNPGFLYLWSSTQNVDITNRAWQIQFSNGNVSSLQKSEQLEVRCASNS
jgi:hypothetical protein